MKTRILAISHSYPVPHDQFQGMVMHQQMKGVTNQGYEVKSIAPVAWVPFPVNHLNRQWMAYSEVPENAVRDGIEVFYPRYLMFPRAFLLENSQKASEIGERAKKLVLEHYTWEKTVESYMELYQETLGK